MRKRRQNRDLRFERLENRQMLAGDVHVLINDSILLIVGDDADNIVEISQTGSGQVTVTGTDTTVNRQSGPFVVNGNFRHVTVGMKGGNDDVTVTNFSTFGNFSFYGDNGNDRLTTRGLRAFHFHGEGNNGDDVFDLDMATRQSAYLYLGAGNDTVGSSLLNAGRNLRVFGSTGNDTFVTETLNVGRKFEARMESGNDSLVMTGATAVASSTRVELGDGNDFAAVAPDMHGGSARFRGAVSVDSGAGDDSLSYDSAVAFGSAVSVTDSAGSNRMRGGGGTLPGGFAPLSNNELDGMIAGVMQHLIDVGIGVEQQIPLSATATGSTLAYNENAGSVAIDPGFSLLGSDPVTGAEISIDGFIGGQDQLLFTNTAQISGSFNNSTGVLTLSGTASSSAYQAAIRSVTYRNDSERPETTARTINVTVTTSEELVAVSRDLDVRSINDPPTVTPQVGTRFLEPGDLPVVVDAGIALQDLDHANFTSVTAVIDSGYVEGEDELVISSTNGVTGTFDPITGTLTLTGGSTLADWQAALRTLRFSNSAETATEGSRSIRVTVSDGVATGATIYVIGINIPDPNEFTISQSIADGTVIGQVVTEGAFQGQMIYQFDDDSVAPELLLNADDHLEGAADASVVLIEYLDLECPSCASYHPIVKQLEADFAGDLLVVRRHFPLEFVHFNAREAAIVAEAANRQGKFTEMVDLLFERQDDWEDIADPTPLFEDYAEQIGLNMQQYQSDVADSALEARVLRDAGDAATLQLPSTPSFILQGSLINAPASELEFGQAIQLAINELDSPFAIDRLTGDIIVRDASLLNAQASPTFTLPVVVRDVNGNEEIVDVVINVNP